MNDYGSAWVSTLKEMRRRSDEEWARRTCSSCGRHSEQCTCQWHTCPGCNYRQTTAKLCADSFSDPRKSELRSRLYR